MRRRSAVEVPFTERPRQRVRILRYIPSDGSTRMFTKIAVIGSGTMGAGIAGQVANAGHAVLLLDLPAEGVAPNAIADAAVARLLASQPPALMEKDAASLIRTGNTRDDLGGLADADWIVEAIVERLDVKRALYARLEAIVSPACIVTSNTSTIPIRLLVEGRGDAFRRRFAITHYFNPVRYMRLLELVRGEATDDDVVERLAAFNEGALGKGVVRCDDTPGFLGNRVGVFALQVGVDEAIGNALPIETADALMGRPMGIPKTGVFGLYDLIGIDLMADVVRSLAAILPEDDAFHAVGAESDLINAMVAAGQTGTKGGGGFYRRGENGQRLARRLADGEYRPAANTLPVRATAAARAIAGGEEPLTGLVSGDDSEARFCRNVLGRVLGYAASLLGEASDSPQAIDDAMKLGFNWTRGPFEMIDALGTERVAGMLRESGAVDEADMPTALADPRPFYAVEAGELRVRRESGPRAPLELPDGAVRFHLARRALLPILENRAASLFAIEGDLRLVEFHSKANALTDESMQVVAAAAADHGRGVLVHNDAQHYSAGVDLNAFLALIDAGDFAGVDAFLDRFQRAVRALKYCPVPVVGAPSGLSLGGGFEVLLHCDALVVHANSVLGLVETGVGLIPGGGGVKETYARWGGARAPDSADADADAVEKAAWKTWLNIGYGATGSSPALAERLRYFRPATDVSLMNRDGLYTTGVARLRALATDYVAPGTPTFTLAGGRLLERMRTYMDEGVERGDFTAHNRTVAMEVASVVCADDGVARAASEDELFAREREAFVRLARTDETRAQIASLLGVAEPAA